MTKDIDRILAARTQRAESLARLAKTEGVVCALKANVPGLMKNMEAGGLILRLFDGILSRLFPKKGKFVASADGDHYIYVSETDAVHVKRTAVFLEEEHPLGPFVDIDVHTKEGALSRVDLGFPPRPCWLCGDEAKTCARAERHGREELLSRMEAALQEKIPALLAAAAIDALRKEVFTYPSFGLVSARDSGCHTDMNISHFLASLRALESPFRVYARLGAQRGSIRELREEGRAAEKRMFAQTGGVNTHKGANYIFGLVLYHQTDALLRGKSFAAFLEDLKKTAQNMWDEDFQDLSKRTPRTRGERVYLSTGFGGVREEAAQGFPAVIEGLFDSAAHPLRRLARIMARTHDTTLYAGEGEDLRAIRKEARLHAEKDLQELREWSLCLKRRGVSPGGAADLLALSFFFARSVHLFRTESGDDTDTHALV